MQTLYIVIIVVFMMASGTTDPVRRGLENTWDVAVAEAPFTKLMPGEPNADFFCRAQTQDDESCALWWSPTEGPTQNTNTSGCKYFEKPNEYRVPEVLANCAVLQGEEMGTCEFAWFDTCNKCNKACLEAAIVKTKDSLEPASYFTFFVCIYLVAVIFWNDVLIKEEEAWVGVKKIVGLSINGALALFALIDLILSIYGAVKASSVRDMSIVPSSSLVTQWVSVLWLISRVSSTRTVLYQKILRKAASLAPSCS